MRKLNIRGTPACMFFLSIHCRAPYLRKATTRALSSFWGQMLLFRLTWLNCLIIYISLYFKSCYPSIFPLTEIFNNFHAYYTLIPSCCKNQEAFQPLNMNNTNPEDYVNNLQYIFVPNANSNYFFYFCYYLIVLPAYWIFHIFSLLWFCPLYKLC